MSEPLAPQYDPAAIEADLYHRWLDAGLFRADASRRDRRFVVMMPPPNVTAVLHVGHGLNNTVQDVLVRFERMRGRNTLWLPGTDHAGIATQNVVERMLAKEGQTRFDLGRERFEERVWAHVKETGGTILEQLKAIGASCDWSRTYFTLDPGALGRRARGVRPAVREGPHLPRALHHQLVPALPHRPLRRGGGEGGGRREDLAPEVPAGRRQRLRHRRHDAPGDDAGRHRRGGASRRRALHGAGRQVAAAAARGPGDPDRRRRRHRPRLRHRRGEGHAGARPDRLRDRQAPAPAQHRHHDPRGAHGARRCPTRCRASTASRRGSAWSRCSASWACWRRSRTIVTRWATAIAATRSSSRGSPTSGS